MNDDQKNIQQLYLSNAKSIVAGVKYFDDEVAYADDIKFITSMQDIFRVNFFALVFCLDGRLTLKVNATSYTITANDGLFVDSQSIVSEIRHDEQFKCKVVALADGLGFSFVNKRVFNTFMSVKNNAVVHFSEIEMNLLERYYELATFKIDHFDMINSVGATKNLLRAFMLDLIYIVNKVINADGEDMMRQGDKIFRRFILMLAHNEENLRSVNDFAERLCVSPKYLSSLCAKHAQKKAHDMIAQSVINTIKQRLLYSDMSVKEIATSLGFDNLSFFGKYVKKYLGESPNHFRQSHNYGK